jgi:hypothetical protein
MVDRIRDVSVTVAAILLLVGAAMGATFMVGFQTGRWWGEWELHYFMDLPAGAVVMSPRTGANWIKIDNSALRFVRIPDPRQAVTARLFSPAPARPQGGDDEEAKDTPESE